MSVQFNLELQDSLRTPSAHFRLMAEMFSVLVKEGSLAEGQADMEIMLCLRVPFIDEALSESAF